MAKLKYFGIAVLLTVSNNFLLAQAKSINVVTTAVPFLRILNDAKSSGMGSTGLATDADINALNFNPGKMAFASSQSKISANYSPWLREWCNDMHLASLAGYIKVSETEAVYSQLKYFKLGDIVFTDNNGNQLQSYHPYEFGLEMGYSRKLSDRIGFGLGIKYIRSDLAKGTQNGESFKAGNTIAADLGVYYDLRKENSEGWTLGAAFTNLGSKISYSNTVDDKGFIPANFGIGTAYKKIVNEQNKITLALDVNKLLVATPPSPGDSAAVNSYRNKSVVKSWFSSFADAPGGIREELQEFQISVGAEYIYDNLVALRCGYSYENKYKGNRNYLSTGAGIKFNTFEFNFSYLFPTSQGTNKSPLVSTLQFGVNLDLNK